MAERADKSVRIAAPAKINLYLRVGPPTADGFHPLWTWMATVGLFDNLEFTRVDHPGITLSCDDPAIACDASNLVVKTASALLSELHPSEAKTRGIAGLSAALQKRIPVGAGLGGGSSDGASTLMALSHMFGLDWPVDRLAEFASRFGSDLPFFVYGPSSICTGRGEIVEPIARPRPKWALLILPSLHMATPAVYKRFDEMKLGIPHNLTPPAGCGHWPDLEANQLLPLLTNDLETPAFSLSPQLAELHQRAAQSLQRIVRMSGSGSTLFTLFDDYEEAQNAARRLDIPSQAVELCPTPPATLPDR